MLYVSITDKALLYNYTLTKESASSFKLWATLLFSSILSLTVEMDFRLINEYWGYETGNNILDTVLKMVEHFPDVCFAYRYHTDIFVSLVDITNQSVDELRHKIISYNNDIEAHILKQYLVSRFQFRTGIYAIEDDSVIPAEIISHANTVRKLASEVDGHVYIYGPHIAEMEQHRADVLNSFQSAIDNNDICIYMQPKIGCKSKEIFHMLKRTHHSIVCEGVETKEVADFLTVAGCNEMQGFYYYKPMPSEGFSELLDSMQ